jgi:pimeloyl-ACP methyl ester carboxylesterase
MNIVARSMQRLVSVLLIALAASSVAHAKDSDAIDSHTANANGIKLFYLQTGQGSGTPVVLLHGYAETSHMWLPVMSQLADGRIVIAPDLRGSGSSEKPASGYEKKIHRPGYPCAGESAGISEDQDRGSRHRPDGRLRLRCAVPG